MCEPSELQFDFDEGVSSKQRELIRNAIVTGINYVYSATGAVAGNLTIFAYADRERLIERYALCFRISTSEARRHWKTSTAISGPGAIFVHTESQGWQQSPAHIQFKILVHEYFHVVQWQLTGQDLIGSSEVPRGGPRWLIEGSAEYVGYLGIDYAGLYSFETARADQIALARSISRPLASLEADTSFDVYPLGFMAVDLLTSIYGLPSLVMFWDAIGRGASWQEAFQAVYGMSIGEFYTQFEEYRRILLGGIIVDGDPRDWIGISPLLSDPAGDGPFDSLGQYYPGSDFVNISVTNDSRDVYFLMEFAGAPFSGGIALFLNTDLNPATGCGGNEYIIFVSGSGPGAMLALGDYRSCQVRDDFPGAIRSATRNGFVEAAVSIETLRILSPVMSGMRVSAVAMAPPPAGVADTVGPPALYSLR